MKRLPRLRIEQPDTGPYNVRVWLDDKELSSCLTGLTLECSAREITTAVLRIGVGEVECSIETVINLLARSNDPALLENAIRILKRAKSELSDTRGRADAIHGTGT